MTEVYKLFDTIPLTVRKPSEEGFQSKEEMEHILEKICIPSFIPIKSIESIYIDNKYHPQNIHVTVFKGALIDANFNTTEHNLSYLLHEDVENNGDNNVYLNFMFEESETVQINIVKQTCKELGITQKELAERLGVNDGTPAQWSSKGNIPEMAQKFMELLIENKNLSERVTKFSSALKMLDEARL